MKNLVALVMALFLSGAHADEFETQDKVPYLISYTNGTDSKVCSKQIQKLARKFGCNGKIEILVQIDDITVVRTSLSTIAADQVAKLKCVSAVEEEGNVEAQPRTGRSN